MPDTTSGRIGGEDRYATAALLGAEVLSAISATGASPAGVLLANGEDFSGGVDALSAAFLSGHLAAPVLLTRRDALPDATADALRSLLPTLPQTDGMPVVHVMGGTSVIGSWVTPAVEALGAKVVRVSGEDRYGTAAAAARLGAASIRSYLLTAGGLKRTAVLASGTSTADALGAGALACAARVPVLLTKRTALPDVTAKAIQELSVRQVVVLGGTAAVSGAVLDALLALKVTVVPVAGTDRYDTAALLLALMAHEPLAADATGPTVGGFGLRFDASPVAYLANGIRFPDALACGPLAGWRGRPLLLTTPSDLPESVRQLLRGISTLSIVGIGRSTALAEATLRAAQAASDG